MKSRFLVRCGLGFGLALLPFAGGCVQGETNAAAAAQTDTNTVVIAPALPEATTNNLAEPTVPPGPDISTAPAKPVSDFKPVPPEINPTPPTAEIIKLANSGVEEAVMLAYVTNSPNTFNLGVDQIVYLKDIGVPGSVVTSMILHDQALKAGSANLPPSGMTFASATNVWSPPPAVAEQAPPAPEAAEPAPAAAPETAPTYQTFYDTLSPYGTWIEVEGYGRVWQPSVAAINTSWRPYSDAGRWLYTDNGWYWTSDYSWGWAPFHYGRWFQHYNYGWCWTPDYVWGPSWVTWRYNSGYCGWAPLPPAACYTPGFGFSYYGSSVGFSFGWNLGWGCYSYVPVGCMYYHNPARYCVPHHEAQGIHHKTVAVNRMIGDKNTVINSGIPAEHVAAATRGEVRKVPVREVSTLSRGARAEQLDSSGRLSVYRPKIAPPTPAEGSATVASNRAEPGKPGTTQASGSSSPVPSASRNPTWGKSGATETRGAAASPSQTRPTAPSRFGSTQRPEVAGTPAPAAVEPSAASRSWERPTVSRPQPAPSSATVARNNPVPRGATVPSQPNPTTAADTQSGKATTLATRQGTLSGNQPLVIHGSGRTTTTARPQTPAAKPATADSSRELASQDRTYSPPVTAQQAPSASSRPVVRPQTLYGNAGGSSAASRAPSRVDSGNNSNPSRSQAAQRYVPQTAPTPGPSAAPSQRSYSAPAYPSRNYNPAPVTRPAPSPSYSAPVQRSMPAPSPAPSFSAPRSAPAPSMTPAPSASPPAPSRSSGGGGSPGATGGSRRMN